MKAETEKPKYTPQEMARAKALILLLAKIDARRKAAPKEAAR